MQRAGEDLRESFEQEKKVIKCNDGKTVSKTLQLDIKMFMDTLKASGDAGITVEKEHLELSALILTLRRKI